MPGPLKPRITAAEKATRAAGLRDQGYSWDDIARQVGWANAQNAHRAVRCYYSTHPSPEVDDIREEEERQLLLLRREAWKQYRTVQRAVSSRGLVLDADDNPVPDNSHRERWISILTRISESRRRLHGADRPVSIRLIEDEGAIDAEIDAWLAERDQRSDSFSVPDGYVGSPPA